jgi:hypothetical protein
VWAGGGAVSFGNLASVKWLAARSICKHALAISACWAFRAT